MRPGSAGAARPTSCAATPTGRSPDLDKAVAMAPKEPRYLVQRAQARLAAKHNAVAMDDIDAALALDPDDTDALSLRAVLRRQGHDEAGELSDLDTVAKRLSPEAAERSAARRAVSRRQSLRRRDRRVRPLDSLPSRGRAPRRGAERPMLGRGHWKGVSSTGRSRTATGRSGFIRTARRSATAGGSSACDAANTPAPSTTTTLRSGSIRRPPGRSNGRGLAELKTGAPDAGHADIAAAEALAPKLAERAKRLGVAPDGGGTTTAASLPAASTPAPD